MTHVWIVEGHVDYEPGNIIGVASSEEAALKLVSVNYTQHEDGAWTRKETSDAKYYDAITITSYEVAS